MRYINYRSRQTRSNMRKRPVQVSSLYAADPFIEVAIPTWGLNREGRRSLRRNLKLRRKIRNHMRSKYDLSE